MFVELPRATQGLLTKQHCNGSALNHVVTVEKLCLIMVPPVFVNTTAELILKHIFFFFTLQLFVSLG